ncbi:acetylornithine deacetylase [Paenibacillus baekrokdamisoli]|uniref:Acetylornithine deacetylase n=1 Tax=Paenibacillus baekrokdamisoli TaxID=1712516 RepID=A0A3G9JNI5_9BACL|nr:M20 family metallopeptidase [Paenibacillus baekrokdamisoli]MBB3071365.1 acetylornithine deacetylase [Paenibacillus baekrokdamisoli]BBH24599.1 acetylornithine deacetylase [Paenibacillus baekrokdamisoli]
MESLAIDGAIHPAVQILDDLLRIQSVNPHYGEDARGERDVADYIEMRMRKAGLQVTRQPVAEGRDNIIAELRVGKPESALLFEAHMDTVSIGSMDNALIPLYRDGRLYGRGACDTKGALAGMIHMMERCALHSELLNADLVFCASVDEEYAFQGLTAFMSLHIPLSGAVVGEPTELGIVVEHKGCARFSVQTHGKAAHSSVPHKGDNAIYVMMDVVRHVRERVEPQLAQFGSELCGQPTIVVSTVNGGSQINIVPENCEIRVDRRIVPGETPEQVLSVFERQLKEALPDAKISVEPLLLDPALNTPHGAAVVQAAQRVAGSLGLNPSLRGVSYGSNASKLQAWEGIPSIVYGPGSIDQAHSAEEWVPVAEVVQAAEFYYQLACNYKGN